jgi:hypothetical protein
MNASCQLNYSRTVTKKGVLEHTPTTHFGHYMFSMSAVPNSLHFNSVALSIKR